MSKSNVLTVAKVASCDKVQVASCVISGATITFGSLSLMQFVRHKLQKPTATEESICWSKNHFERLNKR